MESSEFDSGFKKETRQHKEIRNWEDEDERNKSQAN